ncbi:arylsulfatase [Flexithrix dorotheae]|uniref:arylsulfatase n=1 Tax=Flexithrix dorotheae TaxID=70993 RepID=UPI00037B90C9|nr:arylsulfatase [Flexithrix dorotheae]
MKLQSFTLIIITIIGLLACNQKPSADTEKKTPPNIIYILTDDMGYGDLSCYGQQTLSTPNIDKLAAQGMLFTQHYAGSSVCGPSRAALLTGKHTGHTSVRGNAPAGQLLKPDEITIAEKMKEAGYHTALFGKWGVGHPPALDDPAQNGFDYAFGYINMWHAHNFYPDFLYKNGEKVMLNNKQTSESYEKFSEEPEGRGVAEVRNDYAPDLFQQDLLSYVENQKDNPFFIYYALNIPHANNEAGYLTGDGMEVPSHGEFASKAWPEPEKGFAAVMQKIDQYVGEIEAKLEALGMAENTIIIFTSDNGPHQEGGHQVDFFDSNGKLRGAKRDLYEGGVRIPMIAKWPGKIKPGIKSEHISAFWDILPTFCDIAGVSTPSGIDGISFMPTLLGETGKQIKHEYLYWEFYEVGGKQAIRKGNWKYVKLHVRDAAEPVAELYDLSKDIGEENNLIEGNEDLALEMEKLLNQAHQPVDFISLFSEDEANAETKF